MSLSLWKEFDDFFVDPWRHELVPFWRRRHPWWRDDLTFGPYPRDFLEHVPKEFEEMERRSREIEERLKSEIGDLVPTTGKDGFKVSVDVRQFSPNEITVKTNENSVTIEGKHEEHQGDQGYISRQFTQRYSLPPAYDPNTVTSQMSSDGVLTIKAPTPKALEGKERHVSIQQTG